VYWVLLGLDVGWYLPFSGVVVSAAISDARIACRQMEALSIIIGGLITILTAMWVEYLRRPSLSLAIEEPPLDRPAVTGRGTSRNLRLRLRNKSLPWILRWIQRAAALQCRGEITFHHLDDGQDVLGRAMPVRWVNSPEPVAPQIYDLQQHQPQFYIVDFSRGSGESRIDVYPGEEEMLDVAVRFQGEADCYGWNNEVYGNNWRTPRWRLPRGRYLVKVVVTSSGQKCADVFRMVNDVEQLTDFRLIKASKVDRAKIH